MSLTKVTYSMINGESINVLDYGADPTGTNDSYAAITEAFAAAGRSDVAPYIIPVFFPNGTYRIDQPILLEDTYKFDGDNATIFAGSGFTPLDVPKAGGGTESMDYLIVFLRGSYNDIPSGTRKWNAYVGNGITLDCKELTQGLYIERMPYSEICCNVQNSNKNGIDVGGYCWGMYLNSIVVENFTSNAVTLGIGCNGAQITNPKIWGKNKTGGAGIVCTTDCDANGICISGGFIEKINYGFAAQARTGPVEIVGVDFEVCAVNCVSAIGDLTAPTGRLIGPITVKNCYLDANGSKIYADRATVVVENCRLTAGDDFETDVTNQSKIVALHNEYQNGDPIIISGSAVFTHQTTKQTHILRNYVPHQFLAYTPGYEIQNYQYEAAPNLQSSGLFFKSSDQGSNNYNSVSNWFITQYNEALAPGVAYKTVGVQLDNRTGQQAFGPVEDNTHVLGQASHRWSQVYAANGTINTSDANEKQQIRLLSEKEIAVAKRLKSLVRTFKFNNAVAIKGDNARIHVGVIAQDVQAAFDAEGLDANQYGIFCSDVLDDGSTRLGIRYEELLCFVIAAV